MTLDQIAIKHQTDKSSLGHGYTKIYEKYFEPIRHEPLKILELGTGAYWKPEEGFHGAKTWAEYFSKAFVATIDIHPKYPPKHPRIEFWQGSQDDSEFLEGLIEKFGNPDIIIDDASHINPLTIKSLQILWPNLKPGGWYVVEDCHTSYWQDIASDGTDFKGGFGRPGTIMEFLKGLCDSVNSIETGRGDKTLESIHFHEKIVFLKKRVVASF
jgi:hypothetical protein